MTRLSLILQKMVDEGRLPAPIQPTPISPEQLVLPFPKKTEDTK